MLHSQGSILPDASLQRRVADRGEDRKNDQRATMSAPAKLDFLIRHHAAVAEHSGASLLEHLTGTSDMLRTWGLDQATCDAGLFHSVYGTETYASSIVPFDLRAKVRALIGDDAERVAYYFCIMVKDSLDANLDGRSEYTLVSRISGEPIAITREDFVSLCHISLANWLEQRDRWEPEMRLYRAGAFRRMLPLLTLPARVAIAETYGLAGIPAEE